MGKVTWFCLLANHVHSALFLPHFTFRILPIPKQHICHCSTVRYLMTMTFIRYNKICYGFTGVVLSAFISCTHVLDRYGILAVGSDVTIILNSVISVRWHYPTLAPPGGLTLHIEKLLNSSFSINLLCLKDLAHFSYIYIYPTKEPSLNR